MAVLIGDVVKLNPLTSTVTLTADSREEVLDPAVVLKVMRLVQESGLPNPAVEPVSGGGLRFDKATGKFSKTYRFLGA